MPGSWRQACPCIEACQVFEARRYSKLVVGEPLLVVVDADIAAIDGNQTGFALEIIICVGRGDMCIFDDSLTANTG